MFARLSADTDLLRAYGSASSAHAADLQTAAARLTALSAPASMFGPVGARFLAALTRAVEGEARAVTDLRDSLAAARQKASPLDACARSMVRWACTCARLPT